MRLQDVLREDFIIPNLKAREKRELLDEMVTDLAGKMEELNRDELLEVLLDRENLGSTGIGYGVAIPHGKIKGLKEVLVSFGRSKKGVDFQATDEKPVFLFFLILAPVDSTASHLKILSSVSQILKDDAVRKKLKRSSTASEIFATILEAESKA